MSNCLEIPDRHANLASIAASSAILLRKLNLFAWVLPTADKLNWQAIRSSSYEGKWLASPQSIAFCTTALIRLRQRTDSDGIISSSTIARPISQLFPSGIAILADVR